MKAVRARTTLESDTFIMGSTERHQARSYLRFLPSGDTALTVELGDAIERGLSAAVVDLARRIDGAVLEGVVETVPTFRSILVHYDPLVTSAASLTARIDTLSEPGATGQADRRHWRIPA
ncbi:MAG TPA: carboxyltransferase domain-containing protein, partial [Kiloniellales bacterium]